MSDTVMYAHNAETAAIKYAEQWDADDHPLLQGETVEIWVCEDPTDEAEPFVKFCCSGDTIPTYYAREIKPAEEDKS